jgi:hypothetical protein
MIFFARCDHRRFWYAMILLAAGVLVAGKALAASPPADDANTQRGYLGASLDATSITQVVPGMAAAKAGLQAGDTITALDGRRVQTNDDVQAALTRSKPGQKVKVQYARDGKQGEADVTLSAQPKAAQLPTGLPPAAGGSPHYTRKGEPLPKAGSLKAGLKWLAAQQLADGSFPASGEFGRDTTFTTAISSLSGMALMLDEEFKPQVDKALGFLLKCCHDDGYIYAKQPSFKGMWEHGMATQFLAEAAIRRQRAGQDPCAILPRLRSAVRLITAAQNIEGGWGYRAMHDPHAEVGPAAAQLDALLLAHRAGIEVHDRCVRRGLRSQAALMLPPGKATLQGEWRSAAYEAQAFVLESILGWRDRPDANAYLEAVSGVEPAAYFRQYVERTPFRGAYWVGGYHTLGLYYTAVAYRRMGKDRGDAFAKWHQEVASHLTRCQNEQGAWKGWFGDSYGTAFACLTLAADGNGLETFSAADESSGAAKPKAPADAARTVLAGGEQIKLTYSLAQARTRHAQPGAKELALKAGLKEGEATWSGKDLAALLPREPVGAGSVWMVPQELASRLFSPFHPTARGSIEAQVKRRTDKGLEVALSGIAKFGLPDADMIVTTCLSGSMEVDDKAGRILSFDLETVSGCIRVKMGTGGYVSLNDTVFKVASAAEAEAP